MLKKLCTLKPRCTRDIYITTTKVDLCHTILPTNTNPHSFTYSWRIVQQNNSIPHQTLACLPPIPQTKNKRPTSLLHICTSTLWEINIIYADIILEIEKNIQVWSKNNHFSMACLSWSFVVQAVYIRVKRIYFQVVIWSRKGNDPELNPCFTWNPSDWYSFFLNLVCVPRWHRTGESWNCEPCQKMINIAFQFDKTDVPMEKNVACSSQNHLDTLVR